MKGEGTTLIYAKNDSAEKPPSCENLGDQKPLTKPRKSIVGHL